MQHCIYAYIGTKKGFQGERKKDMSSTRPLWVEFELIHILFMYVCPSKKLSILIIFFILSNS
ncbi:hypothetical protein VCRA2119O147_1450004 [Vibrio crassostreae]|nr:hypothetical protein VCRA2119O145_260095 [Vibrio crassostreae]CAK1961904.1 hypothetical protein VCRA2118O144_280094 [Vibrio crassostreae]CAK2284034.1 hypothetical protein VCRA2119O147_1450004 [Vibrio crassostreae]CAK2600046.1 hypothetical protein VCRA2121O153_110159 [Vibrio crassostreae]CAK2691436.1 hypothetical protein VCRA2120O150_120158 [Vibrio crassostreae]